ncbi:MAG TPA: DUF3558 domain-containing protein [Amycolatopsis sp.]|nr:DUF3558 domain-containing protein [Amycolatopsis sp.]
MSKYVRHLSAAVTAVTALALIAGCSQTTSGSPSGVGSPTTASASASGGSQVPQALDPTAYLTKPCDLVSRNVLTQLGYTEPGTPNLTSQTAVTGGPSCDWFITGSSKNFGVGVQRTSGGQDNGGISKIESLNGSLFAFVEPTAVDGYPAAYADVSDRRANGACTLWVGITDTLTFSVGTDRYNGAQDSCDAAKQIAAAVITTLQGG